MPKKEWVKPVLIVLIKNNNMSERVLMACKTCPPGYEITDPSYPNSSYCDCWASIHGALCPDACSEDSAS